MSSVFSAVQRRRERPLSPSLRAGGGARESDRRLARHPPTRLGASGGPTKADSLHGGRVIDFPRTFDAASSPCLLLTAEFVICGANQAYLRATGRTLEGLHGRFMFDAFPDNPDDPTADGVANLRASLERALATGRPDVMAVQKYDIEVDTGDGIRFEERYWSPVNVPVLDAEGRVELLIHRVDDVTEFVRRPDGRPAGRSEVHPPGSAEGRTEMQAGSEPARAAEAPLRSETPTDHEIASVLQAALLPRAVRSVGSLEVATRYLPARPGLRVCGDWYDVADLGGHVLSVVVGDVVGHGLEAAAVMAQLRGAAAAALHADDRPGAAMGVLERRARSVVGALGATAFIAVIDPAAGTLRYCNAGQVPPLLVSPDRTIIELDGGRSPVLCALDEDLTHPEATVSFAPGSLLIAFTDGLVERAGEDLSQGYERLRRAIGTPPTSLDQLAEAILEATLQGHVRTDDVAMVVVESRRGRAALTPGEGSGGDGGRRSRP